MTHVGPDPGGTLHRLATGPRTRLLLLGLALAAVAAFVAATALRVHVVDVGPTAPSADMNEASPGAPGQVGAAVPGSAEEFRFLATQTSNSCGLQPSTVMSYAGGQHIQGSCCSPMDIGKYTMQVQSLRQYASISRIPRDPYDVSARLAKQLLADDQTIHLTSAQQAVYDQAMAMTEDKGPCCCHCWRWDATEGLAKYLISDGNWHASDVARVVDLVNGCGGPK